MTKQKQLKNPIIIQKAKEGNETRKPEKGQRKSEVFVVKRYHAKANIYYIYMGLRFEPLNLVSSVTMVALLPLVGVGGGIVVVSAVSPAILHTLDHHHCTTTSTTSVSPQHYIQQDSKQTKKD
jgi:hypothetical protein